MFAVTGTGFSAAKRLTNDGKVSCAATPGFERRASSGLSTLTLPPAIR